MDQTMKIKEELSEIADRTKKLQKKLRLAEKDERIERQRKFRPVAEKAHDLLCAYNHTDKCGWGYETNRENPDAAWEGNDEYGPRQSWLKRCEKVSEEFKISPEELMELLDAFEEAKKINPRLFTILLKLRQ